MFCKVSGRIVFLFFGIQPNGHAQGQIDFGDAEPTGTYRFDKLICYHTTGSVAGEVTIIGLSSVITIQGDQFTDVSKVDGCNVRSTGRISFIAENDDNEGRYFLSSKIEVPNGACSATTSMIVSVNGNTEVVPLALSFKNDDANVSSWSYEVDQVTGVVEISDLIPSVSTDDVNCAARYVPQ